MNKVLSLVLFLASFSLWGQYSMDKAKFVKEFQTALSPYGRGELAKFVKDELSVMLIQTNEMPDKYFTNMVTTCNALVAKRMDVYPDIYNYVFSIYSLVKNKQSEASYNAFHSTIDKLLASKNPKRFTDFAESAAGFFFDRKLAGKTNFEWFYEGGKYEFKYDDKPFIELSEGNLVCRLVDAAGSNRKTTKYSDSIVVYNTSGTYDPTLQRWLGNGGTITWEKVGLPKNETYAQIGKHQISLKNTIVNIDSVKLKTPYYKELIDGTLGENALKKTREEHNVYPQFNSFKSDIKINNIKTNVNYEGTFQMRGARFVGAGSSKKPATVQVLKNGKPFIVVKSSEINILDNLITSNRAFTSFYTASGDSITHPSALFNYQLEEGILTLSRPTSGLGQAPFSDSYHKLYYYVPKLIFNSKDNKIFLTYEQGTSLEQRFARFESFNFYDVRLFNQLQGLSNVNPLITLDRYTYKYDKYEFSDGECATALGGSLDQMKPIMLQLANYGFINYDIENKKVYINEKLENYVKGNAGKKDYDNIAIISDFRNKELKGYTDEEIKKNANLQRLQQEFQQRNKERMAMQNFAVFDLNTMDLNVVAVDQITISDKQNTHIFPKNSQIIVKKNRDLEFSGWLNVGKAEINTLQAYYSYENNKINLLKTEEMILRVQPRDPSHGTSGIAMNSYINKPTGEVIVDLPTNRSGNKNDATTAHFPVISIKNSTKVFYNSQDLFKGAYDSTRFYYTIKPFEIDSADNFNDKALRLQGELSSAGIFPIIKEDLKVMPDYSFGFSTTAPKEGLNFYGTGAKYDNKIMLSGNGLQGNGSINFVKSTSIAKNLFTFLPDSTVGVVKFTNLAVDKGILFPEASCNEAYITYIPKKEMLKVSSTTKNDIKFFGDQADLKGTAYVTPKGIQGKGLMTFSTATIVSNKFRYEHLDVFADTSSFSLANKDREQGEDGLAFETNNVNSHVSFKDRKGVFNSNQGESTVNFPLNQYMCKMDMFTWFMDKEQIDMEKKSATDLAIDSGVDLIGPNFFSTHPKQDSLQFRAPKAKLDIKLKTIFCDQVEYINVADARIYPDSMKVNIRKKAKLDQFQNAKIVANYITKYHTFTKATVDITARRAYTAVGEYPYYNRDSVATYIVMDKIGLDNSFQTIASGKISKDQDFKLSPEFDYYGDMTVKASSPEILFTGATRINHSCEKLEKNWLAFSSNVDPKNIQIPVSNAMKNLEGTPLAAGIVWRDAMNVDSIELYPTFLSALVAPNDPIVITSSGFLSYNFEDKSFQIASKEKLINRSEKGNFLSLNTETCSMLGEGIVNLGMDHGEVNIQTAGIVDYDQKSGDISFNLTAKIDFPVNKSFFKEIPDKINAIDGLSPMDFATNTLKSSITLWGSQSEADKLQEDFTIKGELKKIPSSLESTMTLTGLRMKYYSNPSENNFKGIITTVPSAILVNMFDKPVMKYVPLKAFFQQKYSGAGGDWFGIAIDGPPGKEYFFNYTMGRKEGVLDIMTDDNELSTAISSLKEDKRKSKNFVYQLGQGGLKTVFNNLFTR